MECTFRDQETLDEMLKARKRVDFFHGVAALIIHAIL